MSRPWSSPDTIASSDGHRQGFSWTRFAQPVQWRGRTPDASPLKPNICFEQTCVPSLRCRCRSRGHGQCDQPLHVQVQVPMRAITTVHVVAALQYTYPFLAIVTCPVIVSVDFDRKAAYRVAADLFALVHRRI